MGTRLLMEAPEKAMVVAGAVVAAAAGAELPPVAASFQGAAGCLCGRVSGEEPAGPGMPTTYSLRPVHHLYRPVHGKCLQRVRSRTETHMEEFIRRKRIAIYSDAIRKRKLIP